MTYSIYVADWLSQSGCCKLMNLRSVVPMIRLRCRGQSLLEMKYL